MKGFQLVMHNGQLEVALEHHLHCPVCGECLTTSDTHSEYAIHLIDAHWPLVKRIHATTGDEAARAELVDTLRAEREAKSRTAE